MKASASGEWSYQIATFDDLRRVHRAVGQLPERKGMGQVTKAQNYVLLAFLLEASLASNLIPRPIKLRQGNSPAEPDFVAACGSTPAWFEVTEASRTAHQREDAKFLQKTLAGQLGGSFADGVVDPVKPWAADILAAIDRKANKLICRALPVDRHLLIYPNSNVLALVDEEGAERKAFVLLRRELALQQEQRSVAVNGCRVHVVGRHFVSYDLFGSMTVKRKHFVTGSAAAQAASADLSVG